MFAPPIKAPQSKTALQTGPPRLLSGQAETPTASKSADPQKHEGGRRPSWDFSKIAVFGPDRPIQHQTPSPPIQPKLIIGQVNDPLEYEADRVADQVMRMPEPGISVAAAAAPQVSRKCADCEEEEKLQKKQAGLEDAAGEAPGIVREVLRSQGRPLDSGSAAFFGARLGHDFARVRVHSDSEAAEAAKSVRARAYTVGEHIVFGSGEYAPTTSAGRLLLAHELAHVLQQDGGRGSGIIRRREVDDRSCAGLSDVEGDVDNEVNGEISAARTSVGTSPPALQEEVYKRLGQGAISPIEFFIEALPASKRNTPANDLAGTKYAGAAAAKPIYVVGRGAVASAVNVHGQCIGADKLGHFFDLGFLYWKADKLLHGMATS